MTFELLLAAGLLFQAAPAAPEPVVYEGRPIAAWVSDLGSRKYEVQDKAKKAIAAIGRPAIPALTEALSSPRTESRATAARELGTIGDSSILPALVALLSDKARDVGNAAAFALGDLKDERAVEPLLARVQAPGSDKEFDGFAGLFALANIGTDKSLAALAQFAATDARPSARRDAIRALGRGRDGRAVDALGVALKDPDEKVRATAAGELRFYDLPRVVELLEAAAADPATGKAAAEILREVDTRGKPSADGEGVRVTLMSVETADSWGGSPQRFGAKKGYEFVIVRYRLRWFDSSMGAASVVELYDAEGTNLPTAAASAGLFSFSGFGQRKAGEAITTDSAFAAKKGAKLARCRIQGAEFDLASVVPVPRKE